MYRLRVSKIYTRTLGYTNKLALLADNTVLLAIYIDPPTDVKSVPNYTIHCITTGQSSSNITVGMFLERHGQSYYSVVDPPVIGYSQIPPTVNTLNSATLTYDFSEQVVWRADRTEFDETEFEEQGFTKYNADHDWTCGVSYPINGYVDLQTYIRGETAQVIILKFYFTMFSSQLHSH